MSSKIDIKTCLYVYCTFRAAAGKRRAVTKKGLSPPMTKTATTLVSNSRLCHRRHQACGLRPQGNRDRRDRNAGPDGDPRRIRQEPAAQGRAHRRLPAHDHPDRRPDRDPEVARRRRALGLLQHLFDPGSRRRGDRGDRHAGVRGQGREPQGLLGLHPPHLRVGRRRLAEHDPRRRRRRHAADPPRPARRERRHEVPRHRLERGRGSALRRDQGAAEEPIPAGTARTPSRSAASPKRRRPASIASTSWPRKASSCGRRSTSTTA